MKKALCLLLFMLVFFTGCQIKEYTPEIPLAFKADAKVTSGDYFYDCKICKYESGDVQIEIESTNAKGLVMRYNGSQLCFTYCDYSYSINAKNYENKNPAVIIYDVLSCISSENGANAVKTDSGYKYQGKIPLGDFTLVLTQDNTISLITVKSAGITLELEPAD